MPSKIGEIREIGHLRSALLHVVFAEIPLAQRMNRPHGVGRKGLADRDEAHTVGITPDCLRRTGNPQAHVLPRLLVVEHNRLTSTGERRFGTRIACLTGWHADCVPY
jgi:hypothetical protein